MDRATLGELKRLEGLAVPPPWSAGGDHADESHVYAPGGGDDIPYEQDEWCGVILAKFALDPHCGGTREEREEYSRANGRLIAAMRNALPELLAELESYRNAITWDVNCVGCAKHLDKSFEDYNRIKELEQRIAELERMLRWIEGDWPTIEAGHDGVAVFRLEDGQGEQRIFTARRFEDAVKKAMETPGFENDPSPEPKLLHCHQYDHEKSDNARAVKDRRIKEMETELAALRAAADELLLLKDDLKQSDPEEYERRKEPAWDALRKARGK